MKYAVIADIHANLPAFLAILKDAKEQGAEKFLILGDYFMCMPWANETVELIRSLPNAYVIPGNEDLYDSICEGKDLYHPDDSQFLALYWAYRELTKENRDYIYSLPLSLELTIPETRLETEVRPNSQGDKEIPLFLAHGAKTYVLETLEERLTSKVKEYFTKTPYSEAAYQQLIHRLLDENEAFQKRIKELKKGIYLFGHSHLQWHYEKDGCIFINPGSCGFPLDGNPLPSYTLLTAAEDDNFSVSIEERRIPYNMTGAVKQIKSSDLYEFAPEWCELIITEMETAYEQIAFFLQHVQNYAEEIQDTVRPYRQKTWKEAFALWKQSQ